MAEYSASTKSFHETMTDGEGFEQNVFVNCPFDETYLPLLQALLFTLVDCGLRPRIALERADSGEVRIHKILELIGSSRWSIHDISRMESRRRGELARFNLPFELGIDVGCRNFGGDSLRRKVTLVLDTERYRFQKVLSDLSGNDIRAHNDDVQTLIREVRNWLVTTMESDLAGPTEIYYRFSDFVADVQLRLEQKGFSKEDIQTMEVSEYLLEVQRWLSDGSE